MATATETNQQQALVFQYTVEAYKLFQKFAEIVHNPMSASMFKKFAEDERQNRDLLEIKYLHSEGAHIPLTLGADLRCVHPDAKLSAMEIKWGIVPDMSGCVLLTELTRSDIARELERLVLCSRDLLPQ